MDELRISKLVDSIHALTYEEKQSLYLRTFSVGRIGNTMDELLVLLSLTSLMQQKLKSKNPKITPTIILQKILKDTIKKDNHFIPVLDNISILVNDLSTTYSSISSCGLKNSNEIINKIKNLLHTWTPF